MQEIETLARLRADGKSERQDFAARLLAEPGATIDTDRTRAHARLAGTRGAILRALTEGVKLILVVGDGSGDSVDTPVRGMDATEGAREAKARVRRNDVLEMMFRTVLSVETGAAAPPGTVLLVVLTAAGHAPVLLAAGHGIKKGRILRQDLDAEELQRGIRSLLGLRSDNAKAWTSDILPASSNTPVAVADTLQFQIDAAVQRGRASLFRALAQLAPDATQLMGERCLVLTALLKAGHPVNDGWITEAFAALKEMPLSRTYYVSCYLFALDALWKRLHPAWLFGSVRDSSKTVPASQRPRGRADDVRNEILRAVNWLVQARAEGKGHWSYSPLDPDDSQHDFSNTQFAVLGLQIGLEHGVDLPKSLFHEIAARFIPCQKLEDPVDFSEITLATAPTATVTESPTFPFTPREARFEQIRPGGWGYTAAARAHDSMTAAGASCLIIARNGLGRKVPLDPRDRLDRGLIQSYAWIQRHFADFLKAPSAGHREYYALYSLEKVGDLGGVEKFGERDWYIEGARLLLEHQQPDESWGSHINTSLAILFLTRATRFGVITPAIIPTGAGQEDGVLNKDYVYLSRAQGFVSVRTFFEYLSETRHEGLVSAGEEVVKNYSLNAKGDLVSPLLALWDRSDAITKFARRSLETITGIRSKSRQPYADWSAKYQDIFRFEKEGDFEVGRVVQLLESVKSTILKKRILDLAHRHQLYELTGTLVSELSHPDVAYRRKIHGFLENCFLAPVSVPEGDDQEGWDRLVRAWGSWWKENRESLLAGARARELVREIERWTPTAISGTDSPPSDLPEPAATEIEDLVKRLVRLGEPAVPAIERVLWRRECSFYLIEALEAIRGRPIGLCLGKSDG